MPSHKLLWLVHVCILARFWFLFQNICIVISKLVDITSRWSALETNQLPSVSWCKTVLFSRVLVGSNTINSKALSDGVVCSILLRSFKLRRAQSRIVPGRAPLVAAFWRHRTHHLQSPHPFVGSTCHFILQSCLTPDIATSVVAIFIEQTNEYLHYFYQLSDFVW